MKKLILYSDQQKGKSDKIDEELLRILKANNPKIGYIPSCADLTKKYFKEREEHYRSLGINNLMYFDLDKEYEEDKIEELFNCDAIHLSGGNTFYFLNSLHKRNFIDPLIDYVHKGGILIGVSAGSIMMSDTISAAYTGDENSIGLNNLESLGLVDFDFFPHWEDNEYLEEVINYSIQHKDKACYICKDSDGLIVEKDNLKIIGSPKKIVNGEII